MVPIGTATGGAYPLGMSLLKMCSAPECNSLTLGQYCIDHERLELRVKKQVLAPPRPAPPVLSQRR